MNWILCAMHSFFPDKARDRSATSSISYKVAVTKLLVLNEREMDGKKFDGNFGLMRPPSTVNMTISNKKRSQRQCNSFFFWSKLLTFIWMAFIKCRNQQGKKKIYVDSKTEENYAIHIRVRLLTLFNVSNMHIYIHVQVSLLQISWFHFAIVSEFHYCHRTVHMKEGWRIKSIPSKLLWFANIIIHLHKHELSKYFDLIKENCVRSTRAQFRWQKWQSYDITWTCQQLCHSIIQFMFMMRKSFIQQ